MPGGLGNPPIVFDSPGYRLFILQQVQDERNLLTQTG